MEEVPVTAQTLVGYGFSLPSRLGCVLANEASVEAGLTCWARPTTLNCNIIISRRHYDYVDSLTHLFLEFAAHLTRLGYAALL